MAPGMTHSIAKTQHPTAIAPSRAMERGLIEEFSEINVFEGIAPDRNKLLAKNATQIVMKVAATLPEPPRYR